MKILIPLLLLTLGVNANEVVYGSKSGELSEVSEVNPTRTKPTNLLELGEGEILEVIGVTGYANVDRNPLLGGDAGPDPDGRLFSVEATLYVMTQHGNQKPTGFSEWMCSPDNSFRNDRPISTLVVGPCKVLVGAYTQSNYNSINWQVSYKLTKPSAAGTTTSAPILLPPTQDAAKSWFVKLQVSSDLKAWDDVAPGQFLGSDTARFFRIQTSEAE
jgi:hypothetical protein